MSVGNPSIRHGGLAALLATAAIAAAPASHAAEAGMRVIKDPTTGELRGPTPEEFKAMQEEEARTGSSLRAAPASTTTLRRAANGAVGYHVGETFMTFSVAKRNADGTVSLQCVTGPEAAAKALHAPQAATAKEDGHAHQ